MRAESIVFAIAGIAFGGLTGFIIGNQWSQRPAATAVVPNAAAERATQQPPPAAVLNEARVQEYKTILANDPKNIEVRVLLANTYFDAERFQDAITWYEDALRLDPKNVNASTDLGVSYYYTNQPDRALKQFDHSLSLDPRHTKTLLNQGIVRAFGKQDLAGATASWQRVVELAPNSPEGQAARRALDTMRAAHPGTS